jgi:putative acetyltransferase
MSAGLVIERGQPEEARALLEASHALMTSLFDRDSCHFLSIEALAAPDIAFFVARREGQVVGCGALATREGYGEVKSMFVEPEVRRSGVAAALLARLEAEAGAQGFPLLRLETGDKLHAARALYRRYGFAERGPFGCYSGHPQSVYMEKRLG